MVETVDLPVFLERDCHVCGAEFKTRLRAKKYPNGKAFIISDAGCGNCGFEKGIDLERKYKSEMVVSKVSEISDQQFQQLKSRVSRTKSGDTR